jgi:hypothetical protein
MGYTNSKNLTSHGYTMNVNVLVGPKGMLAGADIGVEYKSLLEFLVCSLEVHMFRRNLFLKLLDDYE